MGLDTHAAGVASGAALHLLVFRFGEWDHLGPRIVAVVLGSSAIAALTLKHSFPEDYPTSAAVAAVARAVLDVILGLYASMLIYRAYFHKLHSYPGPFLARLSSLYLFGLILRKIQQFDVVDGWHERYGDIVRVGPNELSLADPKAAVAIYSPNSGCSKGPWYSMMPRTHIQCARNKEDHAQRRRVWDRAFSNKALRAYEPRYDYHVRKLLERIESSHHAPMDTTELFNFFSFDVMSGLAFGVDLDQLPSGQPHIFMTSLHEQAVGLGAFSHANWLGPLIMCIPGISGNVKIFWGFVEESVRRRRKDAFEHFRSGYEGTPEERKHPIDFDAEIATIAFAGADTVAACLIYLVLHLAMDQRALKKLQAEVDAYAADANAADATFDALSLGQLPYLNAVMDETLRLHPPVSSGTQRVTPPEGLLVGETFIPGDTIVRAPTYTIQRDPRNFAQPNEFIPERWTDRKQELTRDVTNFVPFSLGFWACVGKQFGPQLIRRLVASLVQRYNFTLAPGQSVDQFHDGVKDMFSLVAAPLHVVYEPRQ